MRNIIFPILFTVFFLLIDLYSFKGLKQLIHLWPIQVKRILWLLHWVPSAIMVVLFVMMIASAQLGNGKPPEWFMNIMSWIFILAISKFAFAIFHFGSDILNGGRWLYARWFSDPTQNQEGLSRIQFLNQLGLGVSTLMFGSFVYGMVKGKYHFQLRKETIQFPNLPKSWDGLKIIQISDAHLGTFGPNEVHELVPAMELIMEQKPDIIFFTGDLVNNLAEEAEPYIELFASLNAPLGKFSIFGNHDYARYVYRDESQESIQMREENRIRFEDIHRQMGFDLLKNENRILEKNGEFLHVVGIENWGKNFFQYGDLTAAMKDLDDSSFKILLSHDPTHFEEQVMGKRNIALTLSGHTHGAQFGVEIPEWGVKWSPSSWFGYKRWGGLYSEGDQFLYVNRGLGCLGFPGRVGIRPEITLLELKCDA
jgi:uncharacterized protein